MRKDLVRLIASQFGKGVFKSRAMLPIIGILLLLLAYATYSGIQYHDQNHFREDHQHMARSSWENNPDKHPHRMAHFGTFAFRLKHPLSVFDFGIESYTGNAVFLEAHKQNTVNFSEAGFSTGMLRFGELSLAMILQLILPLVIFFIGYSSIVSDRENGTLKILLTQGASWKEILFGRSMGLFIIAVLLITPFFLATMIFLLTEDHTVLGDWARFALIGTSYLLYASILCLVTIAISASSRSAKNALIKLLGLWLLMAVLLPKVSQAAGAYFNPTPTKLEFRAAIEEEVKKYGDSHNPNDPYYNTLRDSVLQVHQVSSVSELPFNYSGFVMSQGEKISAEIYNRHHDLLMARYRLQNLPAKWLALINPYLAIRNLSMALCGTGFESYVDFQLQAEDYRYMLAQKMNDLQIKYISPSRLSGSEGKRDVLNRETWKSIPDFKHEFMSLSTALKNELISVISVLLWLLLSLWGVQYLSHNAKAI